MQPNADLVGYVEGMYASFETGDPASIDALLSQEQGLLGIGTDPNEWWKDAALSAAFKAQVKELHAAGMRFESGDIQAFSEGSVGWIADQPSLVLPNGERVEMRMTGVCRLEDGAWRMLQFHLSIGIPNEEAIGARLTT
jgi:hypothetical protein